MGIRDSLTEKVSSWLGGYRGGNVGKVANSVAQNICSDWKRENVLKFNQPVK